MKDENTNTNTNTTRTLYWCETVKGGDVYAEAYSFNHDAAMAAVLKELDTYGRSARRDCYLASADYDGRETDPKAAYNDLIDRGDIDFYIERPHWFAVLSDLDDTDWGTGSFCREEAEAWARKEGGESYVVEIDENGPAPYVVAEIYPNGEEEHKQAMRERGWL